MPWWRYAAPSGKLPSIASVRTGTPGCIAAPNAMLASSNRYARETRRIELPRARLAFRSNSITVQNSDFAFASLVSCRRTRRAWFTTRPILRPCSVRLGLVGNALSEIAELQAFCPYDGAAEWNVGASEKTQERRLPRAIGAYEADAFAVVESSTKTREYFARPIVTFEIGKPRQFHAEPYIRARPALRPSRLKLDPTDG